MTAQRSALTRPAPLRALLALLADGAPLDEATYARAIATPGAAPETVALALALAYATDADRATPDTPPGRAALVAATQARTRGMTHRQRSELAWRVVAALALDPHATGATARRLEATVAEYPDVDATDAAERWRFSAAERELLDQLGRVWDWLCRHVFDADGPGASVTE